jgi:Na+-driven multidrug efflux pump
VMDRNLSRALTLALIVLVVVIILILLFGDPNLRINND